MKQMFLLSILKSLIPLDSCHISERRCSHYRHERYCRYVVFVVMTVVGTRPYIFHIAMKCKTNDHTLHFICRLDNKGQPLSTKNCTEENCRKDVTGNSRCSLYVLNDPHQPCYTKFFVRHQPPIGLRTGSDNLQNIRYICQPPSVCGQPVAKTFYATMFDERWGIAVFSAYVLTQTMVDFDHYPERANQDWYPTPGNSLIYPLHKMEHIPPDSHMLNTTFNVFSITLVAINGNVSIHGDHFNTSSKQSKS